MRCLGIQMSEDSEPKNGVLYVLVVLEIRHETFMDHPFKHFESTGRQYRTKILDV